MASVLQKVTPWIEDVFVYASSFDPNASATPSVNSNVRYGDNDNDGYYNDNNSDDDAHLLFDSQAEPEPQTENTIPSGLLPSPIETGNDTSNSLLEGGLGVACRTRKKAPPSRRSKIVQVIQRGGDFGHSFRNDDDSSPPYLILNDGQHSAIAFLSPLTLAGISNNNNHYCNKKKGSSRMNNNILPNKSLITLSDFTLSTIFQCTDSNSKTHDSIIRNLCRHTPRTMLTHEHIFNQLNPQLFMCLYLQGPIHLMGAENQGTINNPLDVHCSVQLRQMLMDVERQYSGGEGPYLVFIRRLEACHHHYRMMAGQGGRGERNKQGNGEVGYRGIPQWPWESQLMTMNFPVKEVMTANNHHTMVVDAIVVPGNVDCLAKQEGDFEDILGSDFEERRETEEGDGGQCYLGKEFDEAVDHGDGRVEAVDTMGGGNDNDADVGEENSVILCEVHDDVDNSQHDDNVREEAAVGRYGAEEAGGEKSGRNVAPSEDRNDSKGGDDSDATIPLEDAGGHKANNNATSSVEQGDVAELFENFEDFDEMENMLDLSSSSKESIGEVSERDSSRVARVDALQEGGTTARRAEEHDDEQMGCDSSQRSQEGQSNAAASFVGIDDMILEEDDDDDEEEEGSEKVDEERCKGNGNECKKLFIDGNENDVEPEDRMLTQPNALSTTHAARDEDDMDEEDRPSHSYKDYGEHEEPLYTQPNDDDQDSDEEKRPLALQSNDSPTTPTARDEDDGDEEEYDKSQILLSPSVNTICCAASAIKDKNDRVEDGQLGEPSIPLPVEATTWKRPVGVWRRDWQDKKQRLDEKECGRLKSPIPLSTQCATRKAKEAMDREEDEYEDHRLESPIPPATTREVAKKVSKPPGSESAEEVEFQINEHDGDENARPESQNAYGYKEKSSSKQKDIPGSLEQRKTKKGVKQDDRSFRPHKSLRKKPSAGKNKKRVSSSPFGGKRPPAPRYACSSWRPACSGGDGDSSDSDDWMRVISNKKVRKRAKSSGLRRSEKMVPAVSATTWKLSHDGNESNDEPFSESQMAAGEGSEESNVTVGVTQSPRQTSHGSLTGEKKISYAASVDIVDDRANTNPPLCNGDHHVRFVISDPLEPWQVDVAAFCARADAMLGNMATRRSASAAADTSDDGGAPTESNRHSNSPARKQKKEIDLVVILERAKRLCR